MNIPEDCKHRNRFKGKESRYEYEIILRYGILIHHDGCVKNGGCDVVAYNDKKFFLIEVKSGNISSSDASKIIEQIRECETYYINLIGSKKIHRIFLWIKRNRKRLDDYARIKLTKSKIYIERSEGSLDLTNY